MSPNNIEFDNENFSAGSIDKYINEVAKNVKIDLERKPEKTKAYDPCFPVFAQRYASVLSDLQTDALLPMPIYSLPG